MIVKAILDEENYIAHFTTGILAQEYIEIDVPEEEIENFFKYFYAYKYEDETLTFNQQKVDEREAKVAKDERITELKFKLSETDYLVDRTFEQVMDLNNPLTFISDILKILAEYKAHYSDVIGNRRAWRKEIQELEK